MIRGSSTLIPAHYHASLGGVTASLMTAAYLLAAKVRGARSPAPDFVRIGRWQLIIFGVGQGVFALGFGIGGFAGLGRKEYGSEAIARSAGEVAGLTVMGMGGLLATAGGVLFLFLVLREFRRHWWPPRTACPPPSTGTPENGAAILPPSAGNDGNEEADATGSGTRPRKGMSRCATPRN